jgi:hypothetical protein
MLCLSAASACSPVMEMNRPDPVDISRFKPGDQHLDVIKALGAPVSNLKDGQDSCDIYKLYTRGPNAGGKAAIAFGEVAADIFTLGLAEVIFTPIEAGTKHGKHTVTICYDADEKMTKLEESEIATD